MLASTSMTGADSDLWLAAAEAVDYGDPGNCADYGTCDYKKRLTDVVLSHRYACNAGVRILAQDMTMPQLQSVCTAVARQDDYFHRMMKTGRKPVAGDRNDTIELVIFDDYANYRKYASVIYGISTDNGGMYLEGDPSAPGNQARFIAHEASWLRPEFKVWNLEHEFTHYLDGRYDMAGDFSVSTAKPTVWWIEGVAEYLSRKNDNPESIDAVRTGAYRFSDVLARATRRATTSRARTGGATWRRASCSSAIARTSTRSCHASGWAITTGTQTMSLTSAIATTPSSPTGRAARRRASRRCRRSAERHGPAPRDRMPAFDRHLRSAGCDAPACTNGCASGCQSRAVGIARVYRAPFFHRRVHVHAAGGAFAAGDLHALGACEHAQLPSARDAVTKVGLACRWRNAYPAGAG